MKITIPRCFKPPGFWVRAKTYYVELNDRGLYLIELGNAAMQVQAGSTVHQAVADKAFKHFDNKFEKQIAASEERLRNGELDALSKQGRSYVVQPDEITRFECSHFGYDWRLRIKGGKANLNLIVNAAYAGNLAELQRALGKA